MATARPDTRPQTNPFRAFDASVEQLLGADMRLIYGMAVPILMVCGLVVVLALSPSAWMVGLIVLFELLGLALVVAGFMALLNQTDDDDEPAGSSG
jgi:protein-S-isoprenylcysteine O-methyltransferase Ste14